MSVTLIVPGSVGYQSTLTIGADTVESNTSDVGTLNVSTLALIGNSTQTNSSYLTVGSASQNKGISFLNNIAGYTASDLSSYMEATQTFNYVAQSGNVSVDCTNQYRRIGKLVNLFLGGFVMIDAASFRYISQQALPALFRPGVDTYTAAIVQCNGIKIIGYVKVGSDGVIQIDFETVTAGGTNGLLNCPITYAV